MEKEYQTGVRKVNLEHIPSVPGSTGLSLHSMKILNMKAKVGKCAKGAWAQRDMEIGLRMA